MSAAQHHRGVPGPGEALVSPVLSTPSSMSSADAFGAGGAVRPGVRPDLRVTVSSAGGPTDAMLTSVPLGASPRPETAAARWRSVEQQQGAHLDEQQLAQAQFQVVRAMTEHASSSASSHGGKQADGGSLLPRPGAPSALHEPDYSSIYAFLGSLFDPSASDVDPEKELAGMPAIDRELVYTLMHNLTSNLLEQREQRAQQQCKREQQQKLVAQQKERRQQQAGGKAESSAPPAAGAAAAAAAAGAGRGDALRVNVNLPYIGSTAASPSPLGVSMVPSLASPPVHGGAASKRPDRSLARSPR